ncbi:MAG TPA: alcohol dehydrogenase catalytic domain-containing protein [Candidatus Methylomirabilis sp.]|nr:alcohol dehydrogenase catalytic domain-containing protein [Candidatus Methylomirabilis sp.]
MEMRAARYHGPGKPLRLERVPVRPLRTGEALIRVRAAGVCYTDTHFLSGVLDLGIHPLTLGHEIAGEVVALEGEAQAVAVGDRVLVYYYVTCGRCHWCRTDRANLCPQVVAEYGFTADGGYAEYVVVPAANLVRIPPGLDLAEAATLGCSATTAIHAAQSIADLRLGETAVVYGAGGVGFGLIQLCKLAGARVIAVSRSAAKRAKAAELGSDHLVDGAGDVAKQIRALTSGEGADVVFELVGATATMTHSVNALRRRGRLVLIGYSEDSFVAHPLQLVIGELTVTASVGNTYDELLRAVELAAAGKIKAVVGRTVSLEELPSTLEALRRGEIVGRAVVMLE